MKGRRTVTQALAMALAAALLAGFVLVMQAWASSGSVSVSHGSAEPGGTGNVDVVASVDGEGLGAWTIDVVYDPTVVTAVDCLAHPAGVCSTDFGAFGDTVRMTGAVASGLTGENVLATFEFECAHAEGTTVLEIVVNVFGNVTIEPQAVDPDVSDGSFTCAEPTPEPAPQPTPEPTPLPLVVLPDSGSGGLAGGDGTPWLIALLAAAGVLLCLAASRRIFTCLAPGRCTGRNDNLGR